MAAQKDRVTVIFSTIFKDDDDVVIGKVFMQVMCHHVKMYMVVITLMCLNIGTPNATTFPSIPNGNCGY